MVKRALIKRDATASRPLEYNQLPWGDLLYGTVDQLRSIGISVAAESRGEGGQCRRRQSLTDPRGFKCLIEACQYRGEGVFAVSIHLPGRQHPEPGWEPFSCGVLRRASIWTDDYVGSADALAAAGLILWGQLPGQPGMRKVVVTVLPDGSVPHGAPTAKCPAAKDSGAKSISRVTQSSYQVSIWLDEVERSRRYAAYARSRRAWEARMRLLPRPPPLHARLLTLAMTAQAPVAPRAMKTPKPAPALPRPSSQKPFASPPYLRLVVASKL